jgi:glutamate dehydrogenase
MAIQLGDEWASGLDAHLRDWAAGVGHVDAGAALGGVGKFLSSVPPGYPEATHPEEAARDWLEMFRLAGGGRGTDRRDGANGPGGRFVVAVQRASVSGGRGGDFRLRRVGSSLLELSSLVPALETFGLAVVDSVPWRFSGLGPGGSPLYVDDIGLRMGARADLRGGFEVQRGEARLVSALQAVLAGAADQSSLNGLVVTAGFDWRQVSLLSAYLAYRDVAGGPRGAERVEAMKEGLVQYPRVASSLVRLFSSRLCPVGGPEDAEGPECEGAEQAEVRGEVRSALEEVPDLVHYEALQELLSMLLATTRSNWALGRDEVALKFASASMDFLPLPRPFAEVFVWSTRFTGIHLRFGPVARGGIRWSDRQSDLRAEILDLARAQVKKNSLIIPTGAKGGFALRSPNGAGWEDGELNGSHPNGSHPGDLDFGDRHLADWGREAYRRFVSALLDVTDNVVDGKVRRPEGVVCLDRDDPYLVVAADKGTASFSDIANSVSAEHGYWLGDAFASGGSHGYDHKALGITAKGAWVAVRRHFRALGMDVQRDPLRVVGVGDMSGDVFGNGMLQSGAIRLVAAFDHRHIFVDPDPDAGTSFAERTRLSQLERSSWADYDLSTASKGAAVFSRQDKEVDVSKEARSALGARSGPLTPPDLVRAVLEAPVDLVYFGGIGTFVKALGESDAEVDDSANDQVRVLSDGVRARVVAEGANLALTQRARALYARRGGRVNTDFADNAAGVAMSDREVNLKILLGLAEGRGLLGEGGRDLALAEAEAGAAAAVLATVEQNIVALDLAATTAGTDLAAYEALMADLRDENLLDPEVESLPGTEELARRRSAGAGLSRPELAVVLAHARSELARSIVASPLVAETCLLPLARSYVPEPLGARLGDLLTEHPLFPEIVASQLANEVIARMGGLWAHEVAREDGCEPWQVAGAYWAAREVLGFGALYPEVDEMSWTLSLDAELEVRAALASGVGRLARWYLSKGISSVLSQVVARDRTLALRAASLGTAPAGGGAREEGMRARDDMAVYLVGLGAPVGIATRVAAGLRAGALGELGEVARATGRSLEEVAAAHDLAADGLGLARVARVFAGWQPAERWGRWHLHVLVDDLASLRASATEAALRAYPAMRAVDGVREWLGERRDAVSRAARLAEELELSPSPDLALASIALRAARAAVSAPAAGSD